MKNKNKNKVMKIERNEKKRKSIISQDHKATTTATAVV
jgi:hypothetical protein